MENFQSSTASALLQIFRNRYYVPLYPYKTIIYSLLRDEVAEDNGAMQQAATDYLSIAEEKLYLYVKMVALGDSGFAGSKHIAKMLSAASTKELRTTADAIRAALTHGLQNHIKTAHIEADFIEVYSPQCGFSHSIARPQQHSVTMTLEIVIKGNTFDECLNLFIRRILEEAHAAVTSNMVLVNCIRVSTSQFKEEINVFTMREKRQQVLSILKAAVLNAGEICLDFLVCTKLSLHGAGKGSSNGYLEATDGLVSVQRRYKLSFRDGSNHIRCFSRNPLESVALGLFTSLKEADFYLAVYAEHLRRMKFNEAIYGRIKEESGDVAGMKSTIMLNELMSAVCIRVHDNWERGELVDAGIHMLLFLAIVGSKGKTITYAMQQVKLVTGGRAGQVRAVRSAVEALREGVRLIMRDIRCSPAVVKQLREVALSLEERQELEVLHELYHSLTACVKQVRQLVLDLARGEQYSELQYLGPYLVSLVWQLFDPLQRTLPLVHPAISRLESRGLTGVETTLSVCEQVLHKISNALLMLELTLAIEAYLSNVRADLFSYQNYAKQSLLGGHKLLGPRRREDMPRCLLDTLGYAFARKQWLDGKVHVVEYSSFTWSPMAVADSLRHQLFLDPTEAAAAGGVKRNAKYDRTVLQTRHEDALPVLEQLWDYYALLGEYATRRLGAVDFECAAAEESLRYEVPSFMTLEGAKIRYLQQTQILRAFHEAFFLAATAPQKLPRFPIICESLFKFSAYLPLWKGVSDALLEDFVFQPARSDRVTLSHSSNSHSSSNSSSNSHHDSSNNGNGYYRIPLRGLPRQVQHVVKGGVLGPDRVLNALGPHAEKLLRTMWHLPPILPAAPRPMPGMQAKIFCGLAVSTATEWCRPQLHRLQKLQRILDDGANAVAQHCHLSEAPAVPQPSNGEGKKKTLYERFFGRSEAAAGVDPGEAATSGDFHVDLGIDTEQMAAETAAALRNVIDYGAGDDSEDEEEEQSTDGSDSEENYQRAVPSAGYTAAVLEGEATDITQTFIENFGVGAGTAGKLHDAAGNAAGSDGAVGIKPAKVAPSLATFLKNRKSQNRPGGSTSQPSGNSKNKNNNNVTVDAAHDHGNTECGMSHDVDEGKLHYTGLIELEMVMRVDYESPDMLAQVRASFAAEVGKCCRHMLEQPMWRLARVVVHRDRETSGEIGTKKEHLSHVFNAIDLESDGATNDQNVSSSSNVGSSAGSGIFQQMEASVARCGAAELNCGVLFPEPECRMSASRFRTMVIQLATKPTQQHGVAPSRGKSTSDVVGGFARANNTNDGFDDASVPSLVARKRGRNIRYNIGSAAKSIQLGGLNVPSSVEEEEDDDVAGDNDGDDDYGAVREIDVSSKDDLMHDLDGTGCIDPTSSDLDRICGTAVMSQIIQKHTQFSHKHSSMRFHPPAGAVAGTSEATAEGSSSVEQMGLAVSCYVPCTIRWTLLAQLKPRVNVAWRGSAIGNAYRPSYPHAIGNERPVMQRNDEPYYSSIVGHQLSPLGVGDESTVARLVASTLWFSDEAASGIWNCAKGAEANCILHEAQQRNLAVERCMEESAICAAFSNAMVAALLTQNYRLVVPLYRAYNSLAFKFRRLARCTSLCRMLLEGDSTQCDVTALGHTIARYVCLGYRYILMSPQAVHLRGGCAFLLKAVKTLESLLCLAPIPLHCATGRLPVVLKAASSSEQAFAAAVGDTAQLGPVVHEFQRQHLEQNKHSSFYAAADDDGDADFEAALHQPNRTAAGTQSGRAAVADYDGTSTKAVLTDLNASNKAGPDWSNNSSSSNSNSVGNVGRVVQIEEGVYAAGVTAASFSIGSTRGGTQSLQPEFTIETGAVSVDSRVDAYGSNSGAISMRKALARVSSREEATALLRDIEDMSQTLLYAFARDMRANFPDICESAFLRQRSRGQGGVAAASKPGKTSSLVSPILQMSPPRVLGRDVEIGTTESSEPQLQWCSAEQVMELVLGHEAPLHSIVSFVGRAETECSRLLMDPLFAQCVQDAHDLKKLREVKNAALTAVAAVERMATMQKIADASTGCSEGDQRAIRRLVLAAVRKFYSHRDPVKTLSSKNPDSQEYSPNSGNPEDHKSQAGGESPSLSQSLTTQSTGKSREENTAAFNAGVKDKTSNRSNSVPNDDVLSQSTAKPSDTPASPHTATASIDGAAGSNTQPPQPGDTPRKSGTANDAVPSSAQDAAGSTVRSSVPMMRRPSVALQGRGTPHIASLIDLLHGVQADTAKATPQNTDSEAKLLSTTPSDVKTSTSEAVDPNGQSGALVTSATPTQFDFPDNVTNIINKIFGASKSSPIALPSAASLALVPTAAGNDVARGSCASEYIDTSVPPLPPAQQQTGIDCTEPEVQLKRLAAGPDGAYRPKIVLSRYHDEAVAAKKAVVLQQQLMAAAAVPADQVDASEPAEPVQYHEQLYSPHHHQQQQYPEQFSVSGFRLQGASVQQAAQSHSMLQLLRSYGGVAASAAVSPQRAFGSTAVTSQQKQQQDSYKSSSVLDSLRRLPKPDYQAEQESFL